jgi:hypothetical protein
VEGVRRVEGHVGVRADLEIAPHRTRPAESGDEREKGDEPQRRADEAGERHDDSPEAGREAAASSALQEDRDAPFGV